MPDPSRPRMVINERSCAHVTILDFDGLFVDQEGADFIRGRIHEALQQGRNQLLINLANARIDSAGLGELVATWKAVRSSGGTLKLVLSKVIGAYGLIGAAKLMVVFETFDDEATALRSFAP